LPIGEGWAASSINVVANRRNALYTHGRDQFAAYYDAQGYMVLAHRRLGEDQWQTRRSAFRGNVADAHNSISLAIDGEGYLHVAWDVHGQPLNYARSAKPLSLDLGPKLSMTGNAESRVTYPELYRLPGGDVLFLYRDGESGNGDLVLKRYATLEKKWRLVQRSLISGEGARSPYWGAAVDRSGGLHLAWIWRESPDVSSNHDIAYAFSPDGGVTWGKDVPFTAASAEYVAKIPEHSNLMNSPTVAVDVKGRPYITTYWSDKAGEPPQFHLLHRDGSAWKVETVSKLTKAFTLEGTATRRPPISRAVLYVQGWTDTPAVHLVYRDDSRGRRAILLSTPKLGSNDWRERELTADSLGAWEPVVDPVQLDRLAQFHLLVQAVKQTDGDDAGKAKAPPTPVGLLIVSPREVQIASSPQLPPKAREAASVQSPEQILSTMKRVADWQIANPSSVEPRDWIVAPYYIGLLALHKVSGDEKYKNAVIQQAEANGWQPGPRVYHADDHAVMQAYLELFLDSHDARMLAPSKQRLDEILAHPSQATLDWNAPGSQERWNWCDALFMAPTSWLMMWKATGDSRYLDFMNREWWATTESLYLPRTGWYFRDESFIDQREPNGRTVHWSRGNGWVVGGLARVLDLLPQNHPDRPRYVNLYRQMMKAALAAQQPDGMWRAGLLDAVAHPAREVTGTSFMTFALAWGVNRGLLSRKETEPAIRKAWQALTASVDENGKLVDCQPVGDAPLGFDPEHTEPFGVGAFLLAGSEVYRSMKP
jgi:rhamnogalacturonyl hydrolase YesR